MISMIMKRIIKSNSTLRACEEGSEAVYFFQMQKRIYVVKCTCLKHSASSELRELAKKAVEVCEKHEVELGKISVWHSINK